jgi:hypothetical protein
VADGQCDAATLGGLDDARCIGRGLGERLLDEQVDAPLRERARELDVRLRGRGDDGEVDLGQVVELAGSIPGSTTATRSTSAIPARIRT